MSKMSSHGKKIHRLNDIDTNPCVKEAALSRKCLDENNYLKEKCVIFFENYKLCNKFWSDIQRNRRIQSIKPFMPDVKEREIIMHERRKGNIIYSAKIPESEQK